MEITFLKSAFHERDYPPSDQPEIAFAGKSNVGKSSLINVLVNRKKLVKTSSRPGRTQALNFFRVGGHLYLVDLPGYGYARVPMEVRRSWGKMVEQYLRRRPNLKAVVVILDIRRDVSPGDLQLIDWLNHYGISPIVVLTKADKYSRHQSLSRAERLGSQLEEVCPDRPIIFSAKTRVGREKIWEKINRVIDPEKRQP